MMKRKYLIYIAISLFCIAIAGCGHAEVDDAGQVEESTVDMAATEEEQSVSSEFTFTDALGREVTVSSHVRVATLLGSFCDEWILAGGEVVATVDDSWGSFDLNLPDTVINLGSFLKPDIEKLLEAEPDFVIASANTDAQIELLDSLEKAGITVAYFDVSDFDSYLAMLRICTSITGRDDLYTIYGTDIKTQIESIKERVDGSSPSVLFIRAAASSVKAKGSEGTVGGEILADLGCMNIADTDGSILDDLSLEAILAANPQYVFITTQGSDTEAALANVEQLLTGNDAWNSLSAVQNGNVHIIEKELYNSKPNARWAEAYEKLADILYPAK
ncbi:MAG: ABC transporter substrate-binding protein [Lachnospiraceae bacterium]